jgi:RAB protein geranylgeranyltransferase component A
MPKISKSTAMRFFKSHTPDFQEENLVFNKYWIDKTSGEVALPKAQLDEKHTFIYGCKN